MNKGILYAGGAYTLWGLLPIFWKALHGVPALEILAHRMVWSLLVVLVLLAFQGHWRWLGAAVRDPRTLLRFVATALLLGVNWYLYIWAVNTGHVVETSLGYFITPLINVLLGVWLLGERLRRWQGVAVSIALCGVLYLTWNYGSLPWIALTLAVTFGSYGLLRKTATLNALEGMTLESIIFFVPALAYLIYREWLGAAAFGHVGAMSTTLMVLSGLVTAVPLLLFAAGARRLPLTTLGILQYGAPTIQFALGVLVYNEPLTGSRLLGFATIWFALAIYTIEGLSHGRRTALRRAGLGEQQAAGT